MKPLRISAISYLNTVPFVFGIRHSGLLDNYIMEFDVPASCARKLMEDQADVGIVPVATIPLIPNARIITDYCIGAVGPVKTVILAGNQPLEDVKTVYLDSHSRTSVQLVRILARNFWKMNFHYHPLPESGDFELLEGEAAVLIGDKTFGLEQKYSHIYDLSATWYEYTNLPFVFACWVANKDIPDLQKNGFSDALKYGISHRKEAAASVSTEKYPNVDAQDYLVNVISYDLDEQKKEGMSLFLSLLEQ